MGQITISKDQHYWKEDLWKSASKHHVRVRAVGKPPCWQPEKYSSWTEVIHIIGKCRIVVIYSYKYSITTLNISGLLQVLWPSNINRRGKEKGHMDNTDEGLGCIRAKHSWLWQILHPSQK